MSKLVLKNFSLLTVTNFLNQFVLVFSGIKVARTLGAASYGFYSYLSVEISIYAAISDLGIRNIVIRTIARDLDKARATFFSAIIIQLFGLFLSSVVMLTYEHFTHSVTPELLIYLVLAVFLSNLWANSESIWQGHQKMGIPAIIDVSYSVIWVAFILLAPSSFFNVVFLFKLYVYSQVLQVGTLFMYTFFSKQILTGKGDNILANCLSIIKQSMPYYFNNMMVLPTSSLATNFLERNSSKQQLGYFSTSNRLMSPVRIVINLGLSAIFPNMSALWAKDKQELFRKITLGFPLFMVLFGWVCFSFSLLSKEVITLLFGSKYLPSVAILKFQVWFIFVFALNCFIGMVWGATDRQKLLAKASIANTILATPLLWLGSRYGGLGLANAYLGAYVIFFPFLYRMFTKSLNLKFKMVREVIVVVIMFLVSSFLLGDVHIALKVLLIIAVFFILFKMYYNTIKTNYFGV